MGVFISIISKNNSIEAMINEILSKEVLEQSLHFEHSRRDIYFTDNKEGCLINYSSPTPFFVKENMQFYSGTEGACALHGTVVEQKKEVTDVPLLGAKDIINILPKETEVSFKEHYTGDFSFVFMSPKGEIIASNDSSSFQHIYYSETKDYIFISNRQRCIRNIMKNSQLDLENIACLCTFETVLGTETLLKNVKRLEINSRLVYDRVRGLNIEGDPFYFIREIPDLDYSEFVKENAAVCINRLKAVLKDVDDIEFPITGGRDSRVNLALLLEAGQKDKIHTFTTGYEDHPDVVVGKNISQHYGIRHEFRERKPPQNFSDEEILEKVMGAIFQSDGSLGAWDANMYLFQNNRMYFPGHASEAFKPYVNSSVMTYEEAADIKRFTVSKADFVKADVVKQIYGKMEARVERCRQMNMTPKDAADSYKITDRLPNWQGYMIRQNDYFHNQIQILNNQNLFHLSYSADAVYREMLRIHYEILKEADPWLVETPFAIHGWNKELGRYVNDGLNISSAAIALPRNMPFYGSWQLKLNTSDELRFKVWDILSSFDNSGFWDLFDRKRIETRILRENHESKDSMILWNFIGSFCFYHGLEIPVKIGKINSPQKYISRFETQNGRRGCVTNHKILHSDSDKIQYKNTPQIHAEMACMTRDMFEDNEKYHLPVNDKMLDILNINYKDYLTSEFDTVTYLQKLKNSNYIVFIGARDNVPAIINNGITEALRSLGLKSDFSKKGISSYLAILDDEIVVKEEYSSETSLRLKGVQNGVSYNLYSANYLTGNDCCLIINGHYYRTIYKGYFIVAFDKVENRVVDCVSMSANRGWKLQRDDRLKKCEEEKNESKTIRLNSVKIKSEDLYNEKLSAIIKVKTKRKLLNIERDNSLKVGRGFVKLLRKTKSILKL